MKRIEYIVKSIIPKSYWPEVSYLRYSPLTSDAKKINEIELSCKNEEIMVIGNGPSLLKDIDIIVERVSSCDFVCVNNFATSEYFRILKPSKYVFLDEYFFTKDAHLDWLKQRESTFNAINENTDWKMQIFLPIFADIKVISAVITNPNIELIKLKVVGYDNLSLLKVFKRFDSGRFGPFQGNVLIYAIYLSIWSGYKKISVFGADLSFHKDIEVDQENNHVQFRFRHFNSQDHVERLMKDPQKTQPFSMSELMQITADTFRAHEILQKYAKSKNIEICNGSNYSLIDAYKRNRN